MSQLTRSALGVSLGFVVWLPASADAPSEFPPGPGQGEVHAACAPCHAITVVTSARKSEQEWANTVDAMITRGAQLTDSDYDAVVDYLTRNFSPP